MVVGDDDIYSFVHRIFNLAHIRSTTVYGYKNLCPSLLCFFYSIIRKPESFIVPMRYIERDVFILSPLEKVRKHYCSRYTICIIVAKYENVLALLHGPYHSVTSLHHIGQEFWVMKTGEVRTQELFSSL